jgi:carbon monoxide dehydrogenase subunit G
MIQLQGSKSINIPADKLYPHLADLQLLVKTLPDVKTVKEASETSAVIVVAPSLSFVKGELETTLQRTSSTPPSQAELQVSSKGIGTTVKLLASFTLTPEGEGTLMNWQATIQEMGGLLKLVPGSLIKGAAQKTIEGWLGSLEQRISQ